MSALNLGADAHRVQQSLHAVLAADPNILAILGDPVRAYDHTPDEPIYPYLTYGRIRSEDTSGDAAPQSSHQITLHLWSRYAGRSQVLELLRLISDRIREGMTYTVLPLYTDVFRAPDGRTFHGLLRLSVTLSSEMSP